MRAAETLVDKTELISLEYGYIAMPQISLDCPHCQSTKAAFTLRGYNSFQPSTVVYIVLLQCEVCGNGVVAKYAGSNFIPWITNQKPQGDTSLINWWPRQVAPEAPAHVPDNVCRFYLQGMDNFSRRNFDAAGTMYRKSLDTALKRLNPMGKGNLQKRIDDLPPEIGITPAMKEWAHQIRHLGNDAAHEEDPFTEEETTALQSFTELFLTYVFTLPGMLATSKPPLADVASTSS